SVKGGPYSHGTYPGGSRYGWVEVEDDGGDSVTVRFSGHLASGATLLSFEKSYPAPR
ncbi:MAG: hypothetical protein GWM87_13050, partial [Xanthomonadales bacterium]|nr:hypothetical protein [Xanthomonadales bacterium]NIX13753.1 hypothetical protein [Xanthomonadales bacterium]